jgi:hypothetical protein
MQLIEVNTPQNIEGHQKISFDNRQQKITFDNRGGSNLDDIESSQHVDLLRQEMMLCMDN